MPENQSPRKFQIERIVLRDLSFETPLGHDVFTGVWKPDYQLSLDMRNRHLANDAWEVVITATVTAKVEKGIAFAIEAQVSGVFSMPDMDRETLHRALAVEAPNLIYPYLREAVDNVAARGGFPPVNLRLFDFEARYEGLKAEDIPQVDED